MEQEDFGGQFFKYSTVASMDSLGPRGLGVELSLRGNDGWRLVGITPEGTGVLMRPMSCRNEELE